jgi:signal transduction histidine kinase
LEGFETVAHEIDRLENVVRNFLEFTRPPSLALRPCRLADLIESTLQLVGHRLFERKIVLERATPCPDGAVLADPDQLKQVLMNLIDNAVDAMPGGGRLRIAVERETDRSGALMAVVRVSDTGPGIPADVAARVFEPFFSTKEEGTGLGLCIAANIMARHNGRLTFESHAAAGATFAVWLPLTEEPA